MFYSNKHKHYFAAGQIYCFVRIVDALLDLFKIARKSPPVGKPNRILISNAAHLGDVVIATAVIPVIKELYPQARIGFLVGSWSKNIVAGHPDVSWIHTSDHPKISRSKEGKLVKYFQYFRQKRKTLHDIREVGYDVAVDLYPCFGNTIPLLWQAGVPVRIGYTSGGFGALLTHSLDWHNENKHVAAYHLALLGFIGGREELHGQLLKYDIPQCHLGTVGTNTKGNYLLFHMGAGAIHKNWLPEKWRILALRLVNEGWQIVFTGSGVEENNDIEFVAKGIDNCLNLCGKLNWSEFVETIRNARIVVSVDTVAGHIAAALKRPIIVLANGVTNINHWRPLGEKVSVISHPLECENCLKPDGCIGMDCIRNIEVDVVYAALLRFAYSENDHSPFKIN